VLPWLTFGAVNAALYTLILRAVVREELKKDYVLTQNIELGGHQYAVQPLWSNEAYDATGNGCAVSR
jgi:hypothetical protein